MDQVNGGRVQPGSRGLRIVLEESINEPVSAGGEETIQFIQIFGFVLETVETADIECEVEGAANAIEMSRVAHAQINFCVFCFTFCNAYRFGDEVHARHGAGIKGIEERRGGKDKDNLESLRSIT